jgi:hypothetical protein
MSKISRPGTVGWFEKMRLDAEAAPLESDAVAVMREFFLEKRVYYSLENETVPTALEPRLYNSMAREQMMRTILEARFGADGWDRIMIKARALANSKMRQNERASCL